MARSAADPDSPSSLFAGRKDSWYSSVGYFGDSSYWFGWLDYGDLQVPGRGPVGLHYDWPWIMLLSAMRTGESNFLRLATDMVRHRVDVTQLWSDRDPVPVRGLQRGDANFPAFHCNRLYNPPRVGTNWLEGVALYYMMTGEPKALQSARRNADGLVAAWDWIARTKPYGGPQGDMDANAWTISSYCAMYDLTADRAWLDRAMAMFNTNVKAKWEQYGPFLHDPARQIQSQDYVKDDMKYCYAIRALCQLHHYTGNETVLKLLTEGCEKEMPESFFEAPLFVCDQYAYVAWKTGNRELLDKAAELFVQGFPESRCPPVWLPDNSTWSRQSAMMLRAGHLLQFAAWKMKPGR